MIQLAGAFASQPQYNAGINWGNPITRGLIAVSSIRNGPPVNPLTGKVSTPTSAPTYDAAYGATFNGSSNYLAESFGTPANSFSDFLTVMGLFKCNTAPASGYRAACGLLILTDSRGQLGVGVDSSGYGVACLHTSNGPISQTGASVSLVGKESLVIASKNDQNTTAIKIFQGGLGKTLDTTLSYGNPNYGNGGTIQHLQGHDFNGYLATSVRLSAVWQRVLSDAEMASLTVNPWQIFQAPSRLSWAQQVAAGGGGLSIPVAMEYYKRRRAA